MGDFGSATTTNNSFEPFNADIFKDKTQQDLNESKDSDEGFLYLNLLLQAERNTIGIFMTKVVSSL